MKNPEWKLFTKCHKSRKTRKMRSMVPFIFHPQKADESHQAVFSWLRVGKLPQLLGTIRSLLVPIPAPPAWADQRLLKRLAGSIYKAICMMVIPG
jgi:hypothetical protein